ncbi:MAG: type II/IV secretion system ATPase subunit, partial [Candidatus Thermoplasmatota archaeon]
RMDEKEKEKVPLISLKKKDVLRIEKKPAPIIKPFEQQIDKEYTEIVRAPTTPSDIINRLQALELKFDKADQNAIKKTLKRGISRILDKNQRIRPGFSYSWVVPTPPEDAEKLMDYAVGDSKVTLYRLPNETETLYHLTPFEYKLPIEQMAIIDLAKNDLLEHHPRAIQFSRPEQARNYVLKQGIKLISELAGKYGVKVGETRAAEIAYINKLAEILARYTAGFGISEIFLLDPYIQDIYIDAPASENYVYVTIGGLADPRIYGKCITNVCLGGGDAESLLSRFRYESGRPFSEARPYLECDLDAYNVRVTVIGRPLSPDGIAIALRRHSTDPWTLLKLISARSLTPLAAGLISFFIDGRSTILVAGSRGAGKTSLVGAIMLEFPQSQRILTIEDTLELPCQQMQKLGYKLQSMLVQSSLGGLGEMTPDEALRLSLRLGESAIVLGEVRGQEARTLYEAMRAGTAGSSVLGTIHGNSAKAVYERVVHDMGIPPMAFTATDIIIIAGLRRPAGMQKQMRRTTEITEVLKEEEIGFQEILSYDERVDALVERNLRNSPKIRAIANLWGLTMDEAIRNIEVRAKIRDRMVQFSISNNNPSILSAKWVSASNNAFWQAVERRGKNYNLVMQDWEDWFQKSIRYA